MTLSTTDQDIIASIQSQLDGLRKTADGEVLYRLIERGLKRRDEAYDGNTGQAFVAFLHNILGRYAATPAGDTVTRVKVRLIQQRLTPHMMPDVAPENAPPATSEPIETPVEEIRTETPVSPPDPEDDEGPDPLQAALDQLLAEDAAKSRLQEQEGRLSQEMPPIPAEAEEANEVATTGHSEPAQPESVSPRFVRRPPEEERVPRADPNRPLFATLDDLDFPEEETVRLDTSPGAVDEATLILPGSAPKDNALAGDDTPASTVDKAMRTPPTDAHDESAVTAPVQPGEPAKLASTRSSEPLSSSTDLPPRDDEEKAPAPDDKQARTVTKPTPSAPSTARGVVSNSASQVANQAKAEPAAKSRLGGDQRLATGANTTGGKTQSTARKQTNRSAAKKATPAKPLPKGKKPAQRPRLLELQDTWGPAAPVNDSADGEPDIVVGEVTKPLPGTMAPAAAPRPVPSRESTIQAQPGSIVPSSTSAPVSDATGTDRGRSNSRQRVDQLHETFANKLAESISRSHEYHTMLRTTLKTLKLADNSRNFIDLKRLLQSGLEELLQSSESLGKDLGATSHYLRISQLDRDLLKDELTRVRDQSLVDELTGLHNRAGFVRQLEAEIGRTKRYGFSLSVAVLRMDALTDIGTEYGQEAVNEVLRTYAKEILSHFRGYDWVARIGERRFGILFPNTQKEGAMSALDKAHKRAASMVIRYKGTSMKIPPFTSVLTLYHPGDKPDALLQRADEAFSLAKEQDRDRIILALPGD